MKNFQPNLLLPRWNQNMHRYEWPDLEIKKTNKGKSVFAKRVLFEGTLIPYLGQRLSYNNCSKLYDQYEKTNPKRLQYIMQEAYDVLIDGFPELDKRNLFIGSFINEPSQHEQANCKIMRLYGLPGTVIMATQEIYPGEELTMFYGPHWKRKGYRLGLDCIQPYYQPRVFIKLTNQEKIEKFKRLLYLASKTGCRTMK